MHFPPLISLILILTGISCSSAAPERTFPLENILEGDLAFRCGRGVFSRAVTTAEGDGIYSHVGIVVREGGKWMVVHSVPGEHEFKGDFDRVKMEPLEVFFSTGRSFRGCLAHTGLTDSAQVQSLCRKAVKCARDCVRFDNDYDLEDTSALYCTELVWRFYLDCGIDLSEGRRRYIHAFRINGDVLLPEHLLLYSDNDIYYSF